jgi:hypothetical protein
MRGFLTLLRWAGVAVILGAIVAQMKVLGDAGRLDAVNFLSFFTIQSNLIGAAALAATALRGDGRPRWVDWLRGAATVYLTITFVVVIALLQGIDVGLQLAWVDFALHKLSPVIILLDFVLDPPRTRLSMRDALLWLAYPLIWLAYTLVRGAAVDWYPYPFLDPVHSGGYGSVAVTSLIILVAGAVVALAVAWLGDRLCSRPLQASA